MEEMITFMTRMKEWTWELDLQYEKAETKQEALKKIKSFFKYLSGLPVDQLEEYITIWSEDEDGY